MGEPKGFLVVPIGYNPSDALRTLELDADDNLKVVFAAAAQGLVGTHGWISGAWQKNPLLFGVSKAIQGRYENFALAAGTTSGVLGTVPADEIWVVTALNALYTGTPPTNTRFRLVRDAVAYIIEDFPTPASGVYKVTFGQFVGWPGDAFQVQVFGATLNDDLVGTMLGYAIDNDQ
jgi:hypothetical protein